MKFDENILYNVKSKHEGCRYSLFELATWKNGLAFKKIDFSETGLPVIKIAELNNGISSNTSFTQGNYGKEVLVHWDDLLFSWSGNPQTSIDVFRYRLQNGWLNQHIFKVTPKDELVTKDYLYYILKYLKPRFTQIATNKQTTGLGHVTIADLKRISVVVPSKETQSQIVSILKAVDNKIELNANINILFNHIITNTRETAMERFKSLKQGQNFHSLSDELKTNTYTDVSRTQNTIYLRLDYDQPSGTVVNVRKSMWVHPVLDRAVSVWEAARLQTFPDSFIFYGTKDKQYQQVGNAVPPIMAKAIAKKLAQQLKKLENSVDQ